MGLRGCNGGNQWQIVCGQELRNQAKSLAVDCDRLPDVVDGKEGVDGSSPSQGLICRDFSTFF